MAYKLTIIIPVFNEADNLIRVENIMSSYLKTALVSTKVLFVNDGSTDDSQMTIESICQRQKDFDYIQFSKNYGLSAALKAGFDHINTDLTGYIDADLQTHPEDFNLLLEYSNDYDLVTGIRTQRHDGFIKNTSSKIANRIRRMFTKDGMTDTGCPLKILKTYHAKRIPMFRGLHRFLPAMVLLQDGNVKQVPVRHFPRQAGTSKFGLRKRLITPLIDCFVYLWMKKRMINYTVEKTSLE